MTKEQAIDEAVKEVVDTRDTVEVRLFDEKDDYGKYVRILYKGIFSSKIRYEENN